MFMAAAQPSIRANASQSSRRVRCCASAAPRDELHDEIRKRGKSVIIACEIERCDRRRSAQIEHARGNGRIARDQILMLRGNHVACDIPGGCSPFRMRDTCLASDEARAHKTDSAHRLRDAASTKGADFGEYSRTLAEPRAGLYAI